MTTKGKPERPDYVMDAHLSYLEGLRDAGIVSMLEAVNLLKENFGLTYETASKVTEYYLETRSSGMEEQ